MLEIVAPCVDEIYQVCDVRIGNLGKLFEFPPPVELPVFTLRTIVEDPVAVWLKILNEEIPDVVTVIETLPDAYFAFFGTIPARLMVASDTAPLPE